MVDVGEDVSFRTRSAASLKLLGLAVRLVWQVGPLLLVALLLLILVQAVVSPAELALSRHAVNDLGRALGLGQVAGSGPARPVLWLTLLAAALVLGVMIGPVSGLLQALLGDRLTAHLSRAVLVACNSWPGIRRFEDPRFADDLKNTRERADRSLDVVVYGARTAVTVLTAVGIGVTLAGLQPLVPLLLIIAGVPRAIFGWRYQNSVGSALYVLTPKARRLEYLRRISIATEEAKDVRLAGAHRYLRDRYGRDWADSVGELAAVRVRLLRPVLLGDLLSGLTLAGVYSYLVYATAAGRVSIGGLVMFSAGAIMFTQQLDMIGFNLGFLPIVLSFLPSARRVLQAGPDLDLPTHPVPVPDVIKQGFRFEDVHFRYPGQEREILRGVSFGIGPGESIALVGGNGAGKTTLVKLLLRLYDPGSGSITLDGIDLREFDPAELRRRIGVIFQDFGRYQLPAGQNIGLGDVDHVDNPAAIAAAARKGGAASLLTDLPHGPDTVLGRDLGERELSGGQWQRIALSRAFMSDSAPLVLDEPTAELDPRGEYEVFQRFSELTRDRMTVLVSHRFSTVRMADRIILLQDGVVTESGDHAELLARDGEYARMFRTQAAQYVDQLVDQPGADA